MTKLIFAVTVMLVGMLIVFLGLTILIFCIKALSALLESKKEAPKAAAPAPAPAPAPVVVPAPVAETAAAQTGADANELIAVITAAITAYMANEKGSSYAGKTLVVRNIRAAAAKAPAWARAGRADQLSNRF